MEPRRPDNVARPADGKMKDLTPGHRQHDLTPSEAEKILKRPTHEGERQDPVQAGGRTLEVLFYGILLLAVVGFQLLSYFDPEELGMGEAPTAEVERVTVHNADTGDRTTVDGNRVEKPECEEGSPAIRAQIDEAQGVPAAALEVEVSEGNGYWELSARGVGAGEATVRLEAVVGCRNGDPE